MISAENAASLEVRRRPGFRHLRGIVGPDGSVTKMFVVSTAEPT